MPEKKKRERENQAQTHTYTQKELPDKLFFFSEQDKKDKMYISKK